MVHAQACLEICMEHSIGDFDLAFAYEALANAYKLLEQPDMAKKYKQLAMDALPGIKGEADRAYAEQEISKI